MPNFDFLKEPVVKEFNQRALHDFKAAGNLYLLYTKKQSDFAIVTPLIEECDTDESSYIIPIEDDQAREMASGIDNFAIYYEENSPLSK